ncbi:MAG: hypothetical protein ACI4PR_02525 [Acutalibacteraceae bacterium]
MNDVATVESLAVSVGVSPGQELELTLKLVADASEIASSTYDFSCRRFFKNFKNFSVLRFK